METIVITRTFDGDLDEMVAYARSLKSRLNWPGAVLEFERSGSLGYNVGMRLQAATMTDISIEETLSDVERSDSGEVVFSTVNRGLWPDGHMTVLAEYRFIPGDPGELNTLRYTYSYPPPSSKLVKPKQLPAFNEAMEKVCNRFIKGVLAHGGSADLAAAKPVPSEPLSVPSPGGSIRFEGAIPPAPEAESPYQVAGMNTVVVSRTFVGDLDAMVEYTRSLKSRLNWPGAVLEHEMAGTLSYQVGMRIQAAVMTDVKVEERLNPVDQLDDGAVRFTTAHRILWPDGQIADAITEYLFVRGTGGEPHTLRFSYSYPPPSTKVVRTKELPAFHSAMEKVSSRYLEKLTRSL
jgi:hypothetical protein